MKGMKGKRKKKYGEKREINVREMGKGKMEQVRRGRREGALQMEGWREGERMKEINMRKKIN